MTKTRIFFVSWFCQESFSCKRPQYVLVLISNAVKLEDRHVHVWIYVYHWIFGVENDCWFKAVITPAHSPARKSPRLIATANYRTILHSTHHYTHSNDTIHVHHNIDVLQNKHRQASNNYHRQRAATQPVFEHWKNMPLPAPSPLRLANDWVRG